MSAIISSTFSRCIFPMVLGPREFARCLPPCEEMGSLHLLENSGSRLYRDERRAVRVIVQGHNAAGLDGRWRAHAQPALVELHVFLFERSIEDNRRPSRHRRAGRIGERVVCGLARRTFAGMGAAAIEGDQQAHQRGGRSSGKSFATCSSPWMIEMKRPSPGTRRLRHKWSRRPLFLRRHQTCHAVMFFDQAFPPEKLPMRSA